MLNRRIIMCSIGVFVGGLLLLSCIFCNINTNDTAKNSVTALKFENSTFYNTTLNTTTNTIINTTRLKQLNATDDTIDEPPVSTKIPTLPQSGNYLSDFIPDGWKIYQYVELDFNSDEFLDYVVIIGNPNSVEPFSEDPFFKEIYVDATGEDFWDPKILFAIKNEDGCTFSLSFQNNNLVKARSNKSKFAAFIEKLTTDGTSFSIYNFEGVTTHLGQTFSFSYHGNTWYVTKTEYTFLSRDNNIMNYQCNDYNTDIGIRKYNTEYSAMETQTKDKDGVFQFEYSFNLDKPFSLEEFSSLQSFPQENDYQVKKYYVLNDINLDESYIPKPTESYPEIYIQYTNIGYILYSFECNSNRYLAVYNKNNKNIYVIYGFKPENASLDDINSQEFYGVSIYHDRIYFTRKTGDVVNLISMDMFGRDIKTIFKYKKIIDNNDLNVSFYYEIRNGEIIIEVVTYDLGNLLSYYELHEFYSMDLLGNNYKYMGSYK